METEKRIEEFFGKAISVYTSNQAVEDGILFDISTVNPAWKRGIINLITTNLMAQGYINEDRFVNIPNLLDLLNQAAHIIKRAGRVDHFFSGQIELPSGSKQKIFISQNESGQFTAMLPEDY